MLVNSLKDATSLAQHIRLALNAHGRINQNALNMDAGFDLQQAGLTTQSRAMVMLAIEDAMDMDFPVHMLNHRVFRNIDTLQRALLQMADH
jgi:hypothetical protein